MPQSIKRQNFRRHFLSTPSAPFRVIAFSQKLSAVAPFLPSCQFTSQSSIHPEEGRISNLSLEWIYLAYRRTGNLFLHMYLDEKALADVKEVSGLG